MDARDPLLYRSEDLEKYCKELHPSKASMLLLNKADLLPIPLRLAWADYFDSIGLDFVFWSAKVATDGEFLSSPEYNESHTIQHNRTFQHLSI